MRKPVLAIYEQQRCKSACTSAQFDQHLCCLLPGQYNTSSCCFRNFKPLASLCSRAGRFEAYLVGNPKDRFSRDVAQFLLTLFPPHQRPRRHFALKVSWGHCWLGGPPLCLGCEWWEVGPWCCCYLLSAAKKLKKKKKKKLRNALTWEKLWINLQSVIWIFSVTDNTYITVS